MSMAGGFEQPYSVVDHDGVQVISLVGGGNLDAHDAERLGTEVLAFVRQQESPRIVMSLGGVTHFSSAALSVLVTLKSHVESMGGRLSLAGVEPDVMRVLRLCTLDTVMDVQPDVAAAIAAVSIR